MGTRRRYRATAKQPVSREVLDRRTAVPDPKTWPELLRHRPQPTWTRAERAAFLQWPEARPSASP